MDIILTIVLGAVIAWMGAVAFTRMIELHPQMALPAIIGGVVGFCIGVLMSGSMIDYRGHEDNAHLGEVDGVLLTMCSMLGVPTMIGIGLGCAVGFLIGG